MRVWLINPFDNLPSEGYRPQRYWLMAKAFVKVGCEVICWTSDFSHATKQKRAVVTDVNDGFSVRMVPSLAYLKNVSIKRIASHRKLAHDWCAMAVREPDKPDIIIASVPPLGLCDAARRFAKECGAMFIADVQDAWPETFERILPGFVFSLLGMRSLAKRIYREADGISAVAMRYIELAQKYGSDAPSMVFGHCIEMPEVQHKKVCKDETLRLVYVGNMSMSYDLGTLVSAINEMDGVTLDIAGNGPDRDRICALASKTNNIKFHGYLDGRRLSDLLSRCDVGVIPMFPESCVGVPGKLADYAAANLMVIESLGGETAAIIDRYKVGGHYNAGDVESLRDAAVKLQGLRPYAQFDAFASEFDASVVMPHYVEWVEGLVRCRKDWGSTRGPHQDPFLRA